MAVRRNRRQAHADEADDEHAGAFFGERYGEEVLVAAARCADAQLSSGAGALADLIFVADGNACARLLGAPIWKQACEGALSSEKRKGVFVSKKRGSRRRRRRPRGSARGKKNKVRRSLSLSLLKEPGASRGQVPRLRDSRPLVWWNDCLWACWVHESSGYHHVGGREGAAAISGATKRRLAEWDCAVLRRASVSLLTSEWAVAVARAAYGDAAAKAQRQTTR